jgi:hypothetical protein
VEGNALLRGCYLAYSTRRMPPTLFAMAKFDWKRCPKTILPVLCVKRVDTFLEIENKLQQTATGTYIKQVE